MNYKWTYEGKKSFRQILIILLGEILLCEIFLWQNYSSGEIFVTLEKIRHFRQTKFSPIRYLFGKSGSAFFNILTSTFTAIEVIKDVVLNFIGYFVIYEEKGWQFDTYTFYDFRVLLGTMKWPNFV